MSIHFLLRLLRVLVPRPFFFLTIKRFVLIFLCYQLKNQLIGLLQPMRTLETKPPIWPDLEMRKERTLK